MAKGIMYIDGQRVPFDGEKNVLAVIRKAGIDMPTFCYYSELSTFGACRMCVVEDEKGKIDASCSMEPRDGMKIRTNLYNLPNNCGICIKEENSICYITEDETQTFSLNNFVYHNDNNFIEKQEISDDYHTID